MSVPVGNWQGFNSARFPLGGELAANGGKPAVNGGEPALHYAKVTRAANDTHADCLRIITRAEMRMADEIDRGQAEGQVARNDAGGRNLPVGVRASDTEAPTTYDDLGISRQRVSEWREVREAGPAVVEQAIQGALSEGRAPTKADIRNHVRGTFGTGENE